MNFDMRGGTRKGSIRPTSAFPKLKRKKTNDKAMLESEPVTDESGGKDDK
jgi:hypothetical protein